ncbi:hypothetical protein BDV23DRAFT_171875 [Aspergillus alliaceus]|uniref:NAD(P)-binding protein n=1 Tax=Petromyces alliaceus TaxID=209559 RepID=A0A5N7CAI1_PETAA|nr:hypothetical protein BDV23DRAFT_171875 [Aspergillus alliaceus]
MEHREMPRCALITGCSAGGIGSALVEELHSQGLKVYTSARSLAKMNYFAKLPNVILVTLDVVDPVSIVAGVDTAKRLFDVNFWGVVAVTQAFMPLLQAAKNDSTLVNVCSISGFLYAPWMSVYNASKAALMSWSETLRLELQPFNIRVIYLVTGSVATNKALPEIEARGVRKDISSKSTPADFAREIVKDVLGGASGPVWRGAMASMVKFVSKYMPTTVLVSAPGLFRFPLLFDMN